MTDYIINCLVFLLFLSLSRIFHSYGGITIVGERLQNLSLLLASVAFEQWGNWALYCSEVSS